MAKSSLIIQRLIKSSISFGANLKNKRSRDPTITFHSYHHQASSYVKEKESIFIIPVLRSLNWGFF